MLWTIADDDGRARANSRMLASLLFPYDDDAPRLIHEWLFELEREHCIKLYSVDGNAYLQIEKWLTHQKIDRATPSRLPAPLANAREESRKLATDLVPSILDQDLGPNTLPADAGGVPIPKPKVQKTTDYPQEFEQFWKAYDPPKNATKPDALKSWQRSADVRPPLTELLASVAAYRSWIAAESRKRKDPYPIKHPATWLNKRGWESFLASARSAPDPAVQDRADQLMRRGKYAEQIQ